MPGGGGYSSPILLRMHFTRLRWKRTCWTPSVTHLPWPRPAPAWKKLVQEFQTAVSGNDVKFAIAIVPDRFIRTSACFLIEPWTRSSKARDRPAGSLTVPVCLGIARSTRNQPTFAPVWDSRSIRTTKEALPGLMIFRYAIAKNLKHTLYVFVVGENSDRSVNKDQFRTALDLISACRNQGVILYRAVANHWADVFWLAVLARSTVRTSIK